MVLDFALPEISEAETLAHLGAGGWARRERFETRITYDTIPDSAAARLFGAPRPRAPVAGRVPPPARAPVAAGLLARARASLGRWLDAGPADPDDRASNAFAVGPRRSATGHALFANDPHLPLGDPSPLHVVHVSVPGVVDAVGAAVPGLPVIVSGRNRDCAWGITSLSADVMDVYADTLSRDGRSVRVGGAWHALEQRPFSLRYRLPGGVTVPVAWVGQTRRYSPHGPVVVFDRRRGIALSVRWAADDSLVTLRGMVGLERARSAAAIAAAFRTLALPTLNVVAADARGEVVYQTSGAVPRRGFEPGPGPLPGDGRHEWLGRIAPEDMPAWRVPPGGVVVNANNRPVGPAYPEPWPRFDWQQDRALRIAERLDADPRLTLDDLRSVQNDVFSRPAARLLPLLLAAADSLPGHPERVRAALDTLRAWNFVARRDRVGPTLFRAWYGAFLRRSRFEGVPGLAHAALAGEAPAELLAPGGDGPERAAVAASAALDTALARLTALLGPDLATWTWGRAHKARFRHRLAAAAPGFAAPDVPVDGENGSPCVGRSSLPWSPTVTHGPAFRHLVDLGNPDSSWAVIAPGNSGVPASGHHRDLLAAWRDHRYVALVLPWERVLARGGRVARLLPAPASPPAAR
jgi:penicillin amidase